MENARFCTRCGTMIDQVRDSGIICSECSTPNPSYASFCMECGSALANSDLQEFEDDYEFLDKIDSLELTPAESLLIMDLDADGKELFKLTMLDLLARGVIKIQTFQEDRGISITKPGLFHELQRGEEFETRLQPYEEIFRQPLYSYDEIELYQYVSMVLKNITPIQSNSFSQYKEQYLINPLLEDGYIAKVKKQDLRSGYHYRLTKFGENIRRKINNILDDADHLGEWVDTDPERAKAFLSAVGSHIFILNYDLDTLRFLENTLKEVRSNPSKFYAYYLFPTSFLEGIKSEQDVYDIFGMNALRSFEFFETLDPFDDIFDAFE